MKKKNSEIIGQLLGLSRPTGCIGRCTRKVNTFFFVDGSSDSELMFVIRLFFVLLPAVFGFLGKGGPRSSFVALDQPETHSSP